MKKTGIVLSFICLMTVILTGCTGVEPEKREYPQVMGVDYRAGNYEITYAMPNMAAATGQDKAGGGSQSETKIFRGRTMEEIMEQYNKTQEKYLDLGHVQILIMGNNLIREEQWEYILENLKKDTTLGEDMYVFQTEDVQAVMDYNGSQTDSLGNYLIGIYENRPYFQGGKGVSLRRVYKGWYENGNLEKLPYIGINEEGYLSVE